MDPKQNPSPAADDMHPAGNPGKIEYLALEGGGGKGGAYLGAIIALEELEILPIATGENETNQLKGIAGASAGSITAFLLAIGQTSRQMWTAIGKGTYKQFMDAPRGGYARRAVFADDEAAGAGGEIRDPRYGDLSKLSQLRKPGETEKAVQRRAAKQLRKSKRRSKFLLPPLLRLLHVWKKIEETPAEFDDKIGEALHRDLPGYLRNFLNDPGLFPAFAVRNYLVDLLARRIALSTGIWAGSKLAKETAKTFTFQQFLELTKIDLVIAGTNLSTGTPHFFSAQTTPTFPVVEAVGLSMSIPIMFKPVWIDTKKDDYAKYRGWWGDGGISLNLPLHAFNKDANGEVPAEARTRALQPLNKAVLGMTLSDGDLTQFGKATPAPRQYPTVLGIAGLVMEALLYNSSEGQVRDRTERSQVVWLQAYFLETYDLTVDPLLVAATVFESRYRVHRSLVGAMPREATHQTLLDALAMINSNGKALTDLTTAGYVAKIKQDLRTKLY